MSRRMSVSMTLDAVRARTKTVTRRHHESWRSLEPGDRLTLIEKGMGLPKGAKQVVVTEVEITDVRVEPLALVLIEDGATAAGRRRRARGRHLRHLRRQLRQGIMAPSPMHAIEIAAGVCVGRPETLIPTAQHIVTFAAMGVGIPMCGHELTRRLQAGEHWDVQYLTGDDASFFAADHVTDDHPDGIPAVFWAETFGQICLVVREA